MRTRERKKNGANPRRNCDAGVNLTNCTPQRMSLTQHTESRDLIWRGGALFHQSYHNTEPVFNSTQISAQHHRQRRADTHLAGLPRE